MTEKQQNKNHENGSLSGIKMMIWELGNIFCCHVHFCHDASGIIWNKKLLNSIDVGLLPIIPTITLTGFKPLGFAVRVMPVMIETLRLPRSVMLSRNIFQNKTAFLMPCSAKLFAGEITRYLRSARISSLKLIRRLCMLTFSWCFNSVLEHNSLNYLPLSARCIL